MFAIKPPAPLIPMVIALAMMACAGGQPTPTATVTPVPTATPDLPATVQAGIESTRTAEAALEATMEARIAATREAAPPTATPSPTPDNQEEEEEKKVIRDFFNCLEGNLALAGAFTSGYEGPFSEQVQIVLDGVGDVTSRLHDWGAFRGTVLVAMSANPGLEPALLAINLGCSLIGSAEAPETPEPNNTATPEATITPTPEPTPTPEEDPDSSGCAELVPKIIELSKDNDPSDDPISDITGIHEISDNLLGIECKGLSHTQSGDAKWIKFHQNRLGRLGYESLSPGEYECQYLIPRIIELNQGRNQEILEITDTEELDQNNDELICRGTAKTSDREFDVEFYLEASDEGQHTFGYEVKPAS